MLDMLALARSSKTAYLHVVCMEIYPRLAHVHGAPFVREHLAAIVDYMIYYANGGGAKWTSGQRARAPAFVALGALLLGGRSFYRVSHK